MPILSRKGVRTLGMNLRSYLTISLRLPSPDLYDAKTSITTDYAEKRKTIQVSGQNCSGDDGIN
jgi:hypothetical protein